MLTGAILEKKQSSIEENHAVHCQTRSAQDLFCCDDRACAHAVLTSSLSALAALRGVICVRYDDAASTIKRAQWARYIHFHVVHDGFWYTTETSCGTRYCCNDS